MQKIILDRYDVSILDSLQDNCQVPRLELAEKVGLSASQCFRRVKRLEDVGLIEQYAAILNKEKIGIEVSATVFVQYRKSELQAREKLIELINQIDIIQECYAITGEHDFLIQVHCRNMKEFNRLINDTFQVDYISGSHSYILTDCIKSSRSFPVQETG